MKPEINDLNEKLDLVTQTGSCETCKELCGILRELLEHIEPNMNRLPDRMEQTVTELLLEIGVPAHLHGFGYARAAIITAVEDRDSLRPLMKGLYPGLAQRFGTSAQCVERSIRHAIEVAWDRGDMETQQKYFGNTVSASKGRPTTGEFIFTIADQLRIGGH